MKYSLISVAVSVVGRIAGPVNELAVSFLADLHVMDVCVFVAQKTADHLAIRRKDEDTNLALV